MQQQKEHTKYPVVGKYKTRPGKTGTGYAIYIRRNQITGFDPEKQYHVTFREVQ